MPLLVTIEGDLVHEEVWQDDYHQRRTEILNLINLHNDEKHPEIVWDFVEKVEIDLGSSFNDFSDEDPFEFQFWKDNIQLLAQEAYMLKEFGCSRKFKESITLLKKLSKLLTKLEETIPFS